MIRRGLELAWCWREKAKWRRQLRTRVMGKKIGKMTRWRKKQKRLLRRYNVFGCVEQLF